MSNSGKGLQRPGKGWPPRDAPGRRCASANPSPGFVRPVPKTAQGKGSQRDQRPHAWYAKRASLAEFRRVRRYLRLCRERTDLVAAYLRGRVAIADVKSSFAVSYMREFASPGLGAQRSATVTEIG